MLIFIHIKVHSYIPWNLFYPYCAFSSFHGPCFFFDGFCSWVTRYACILVGLVIENSGSQKFLFWYLELSRDCEGYSASFFDLIEGNERVTSEFWHACQQYVPESLCANGILQSTPIFYANSDGNQNCISKTILDLATSCTNVSERKYPTDLQSCPGYHIQWHIPVKLTKFGHFTPRQTHVEHSHILV